MNRTNINKKIAEKLGNQVDYRQKYINLALSKLFVFKNMTKKKREAINFRYNEYSYKYIIKIIKQL